MSWVPGDPITVARGQATRIPTDQQYNGKVWVGKVSIPKYEVSPNIEQGGDTGGTVRPPLRSTGKQLG